MVSEAMKNLSAYVTYQDFLKLEETAKEYENNAVLKHAKKGDYSLFIRLLFFTGARIAEVVGVPKRVFTQCLHFNKRKGNCPKWIIERDDAVCLRNSCPHLSTYIQKEHHGIRVRDIVFKDRLIAVYGKSVKSNELKARTIIIDIDTLNLIQEHIKKYSIKPNEKIINLNANGAKLFLEKLRERAGLQWVTAHKFRHGHAVYCIQHGMDLRTLQQQLGHEDLGTTAVYLQFAVKDRKAAYDKVFGAKPDYMKVQCPSCGFVFKLKTNKEIDLEDRIKAKLSIS
ncbi:MAG TPA: site-specific integrase [Candidatus Methylomirabilis sp.]|nr:site-specific integrase [Candidatus Methylomirabilis sp.]